MDMKPLGNGNTHAVSGKGRYRWKVAAIPAVLLFVLSFPVEASAANRVLISPMQVREVEEAPPMEGKWKVSTGIGTSARYEDNFYRSENDRHGVYTYLVQPGIRLDYRTAKSVVHFLYSLDAHFYNDRDGGARSAGGDDFIGHSLALTMRTSPTLKLTLGIDNHLDVTREQSKSDRFVNESDRERFFVNRFAPGLHYRIGDHFSTALSYENTIVDYRRRTDQDSIAHRGIWEGYYDISPRTSVGLKYQYWQRDYEVDASDYTSNQSELVFNRRGRYLELEAGAGYQHRDFDADGRSNEDLFNYRVALTGRTADTPLGYPRSFLTAAFSRNFNDSGLRDDFFEATELRLTAGRVFRDRLLLELGGFYLNADYPQQVENLADGRRIRREDDRYGVEGSLSYGFREWLHLKLSGGYEERDSNMPGFDFDNTFVQLGLNFDHDLGSR
jgi:polysaccharide biosynthesis protein VpsM